MVIKSMPKRFGSDYSPGFGRMAKEDIRNDRTKENDEIRDYVKKNQKRMK